MIRSSTLLVFLLLALSGFSMSNGEETTLKDSVSIKGRITGELKGIVVDEKGDPVKGAVVAIDGTHWTCTTDESGTYNINGIKAATYSVTVTDSNKTISVNKDIHIDVGLTVTENFKLVPKESLNELQKLPTPLKKYPTGSIQGKVLDDQGNPLPGANIMVLGTTWGAEADDDGNFNISEIRTGTYTFKAEFVGYTPLEVRDVKIASDSNNAVKFKLRQERLHFDSIQEYLPGSVFDQNNKPLKDVKISIVGTEFITKTDSNGIFKFTGLEKGKYNIKAELNGYNSFQQDSVKFGRTGTITLLQIKLVKKECDDENKNPRTINIESIEKLEPTIVEKPIIYLYPEKETKVNVKLDYKGTFTATYPKYPDNGWTVTAKPDGTLTDKNGKKYYSLFWEGVDNKIFTLNEGFVVKKEDTADFLERSLTILGLNYKEANEFVIYWLPELEKHPYNLIHFSTKEYEELAELTVEPKPDIIIRVFMVFKGLDKLVEIKEQKLVPKTRKGFTVVEWGGTELRKRNPILPTNNG